jgi:hypothetical protein
MKRRMSRTSLPLDGPNKSIANKANKPPSAAGSGSGALEEPSNLKKKEQRGRFVISGEDGDENENEKDELQQVKPKRSTKPADSSSKPPKRPQEQSSSQKQNSMNASITTSKLDQSLNTSDREGPMAALLDNGGNHGNYNNNGGNSEACSVSPQVLQYLQGMQMNLQHQQDTLNYLLSGSGGVGVGGSQMMHPSMSPRPHHSLHESDKSDKHHAAALLKSLESATLSVKSLCDENDKLKKRNLHLERELTKCQNKLLELQEAKEMEEEEEEMAHIERVSSEVISDRDHARRLANANRSLSDKSLTKGTADQ